jgi:3-hydroxyisobutyrate dehydrogenase-like beta-hydroxyacid dehydrogenase
MSDITVIGLGVMGSALAQTLLQSGYKVTVWNRTPNKAADLADRGAITAVSCSEAITASPLIVICIKSHSDTRQLLESAENLESKNIIELSTGSAPEAESLAEWIRSEGAGCLIGMICTFPRDIGNEDSTIVTVGDEALWEQSEKMLKTLAGKSTYIGDNIGSLAILYSALFLPRQGFMFGMIYGALLCKKVGLPMQTYVEQMPLTIKVVNDYYDVFASSVLSDNYSDPQASIDTYIAAFADTLESFRNHNVNDELPKLMASLLDQGANAGLGDKQITSLINVLRNE